MASSLVAKDAAAPFGGRVGLDPGGVAHFGFVSFDWLTTIVTVRRGRGGVNGKRCNGVVVAKLAIACQSSAFRRHLKEATSWAAQRSPHCASFDARIVCGKG